MARRTQSQRLHHSLWDRLTRPELIVGDAGAPSKESEINRLKRAVRQDLEWLLNARRPHIDLPTGMESLARSLIGYGLPDFTSMNLAAPSERNRMHRILEDVLRDFEPRLFDVRIIYNELDQDRSRTAMHYRIEAMLRTDPHPEPVVFDTVLQLSNRAFVVNLDAQS